LAILAISLALMLFGLDHLGRFLTSPDPLQRADAVYVLGGTFIDRALEALHLYREGYTPRIVLSPDRREKGAIALERQGVHMPSTAEVVKNLFVTSLGVPAADIEVIPGSVDNTAQEADAIRSLIEAGHWRRLIVISDCATTRRAGYAMRRVIGPEVLVISRCSRYDTYNPDRWWHSRADVRTTFYEAPKLLAYWLGLKG
jgi:uncharacterized SAM-binding protein YcdF (DUF218 family)